MANKPLYSLSYVNKNDKTERINLLTIWPGKKDDFGGFDFDLAGLEKLIKLGASAVKEKYWANWNSNLGTSAKLEELKEAARASFDL